MNKLHHVCARARVGERPVSFEPAVSGVCPVSCLVAVSREPACPFLHPQSISIRQLDHVKIHAARVAAVDRAVGIMLKSVAEADPPEWHYAQPGRPHELKWPAQIMPPEVIGADESTPQTGVNRESAVSRSNGKNRGD